MLDIIDWYWVSLSVFVALVALIFILDRKNVEAQGIFFLRKTQHGKKLMISFGERFPRFWKVISTVGVFVGFFFSVFMLVMLLSIFIDSLIKAEPVPGVGLALPTATSTIGMGFVGIPIWYWIAGLALLIVVHEGLHGVIAASQRIRIKSLGWGALLFLPLA